MRVGQTPLLITNLIRQWNVLFLLADDPCVGGNESAVFCCSMFSELQSLHVSQKGIVYCEINWSPSGSRNPLNHYTCLLESVFTENHYSLLWLPTYCLSSCLCGCRVSSCRPGSTVADVSIVRCWFLQSEGMFLPREELHTNSNFWRNHAGPLHPHHLTFLSLVATPHLWGQPWHRREITSPHQLPQSPPSYLHQPLMSHHCQLWKSSSISLRSVAHCCPGLCMWSTACSVASQAQPFYLLKATGKVLSLQTAHFPFTLRSVS